MLYLSNEGSDQYGAEHGVGPDAAENVPLPVYLPGVDLVEYLHHDERVEDDGEVLGGGGVKGKSPAVVYVEQLLA